MISKGYTLWLMQDEMRKKFAGLIKKLGAEYGGPIFEPHVTLLGGIELPQTEVIRRSEQLVHGQKSFPIILRQIDYEDYFFRTLFIKAEVTEQLQNLHNRAKEIFEIGGTSTYMPHLSLLYGNYPVELKERIIKKIGQDQTFQFQINSVHLVKGGEVKDWQIIRAFPF